MYIGEHIIMLHDKREETLVISSWLITQSEHPNEHPCASFCPRPHRGRSVNSAHAVNSVYDQLKHLKLFVVRTVPCCCQATSPNHDDLPDQLHDNALPLHMLYMPHSQVQSLTPRGCWWDSSEGRRCHHL